MERASRRTFLSAAAVTAPVASAGCLGRGRNGEEPTTTTVTGIDDLSFSASVDEQQTADTPATIDAALRNTGESTVRIRAIETITPRYEDGPGYNVLLFPKKEVGPNDPPEESTNGCWRYTDSDYLTRDIAETHTIDPGKALRERYRVFTRGEDRPCLPDGEYRFTDSVRDENDNELQLIIDVSITDGRVSVDGTDEPLEVAS